jgi:hypothetical protein
MAMAVRRTLIERGNARMTMWEGSIKNGVDDTGIEEWINGTAGYLAHVVAHLASLPPTLNRRAMIDGTEKAIAAAWECQKSAVALTDTGHRLNATIGELVKYMGLFTRPEEPSGPTPQDRRQKSIELARKRAERELPPSSDDEASALGAMALKVRDLERALKNARELNIEHALRISMMHRQVGKLLSGEYMPTPDAITRALYVSRDALNAELERTYGKKPTPKV